MAAIQYIKHDFAHNYTAYSKYGENELLLQMIYDEIAQIIVFGEKQLLIAIADSGYTINSKPSRKYLAKFLIKKLPTDKELRDKVASIIINNNFGNPDTLNNEKNIKSIKLGEYIYSASEGEEKKSNPMAQRLFKDIYNRLEVVFLNAEGDEDDTAESELEKKVDNHYRNKLEIRGEIVSKDELRIAVKKARIHAALITAAAFVSTYFIIGYINKRYPNLFARGGNIEPINNEGISDSDDLGDFEMEFGKDGGSNEPQPPKQPVNTDGYDEYGFKIE